MAIAMNTIFYAHSENAENQKETAAEHLHRVEKVCGESLAPIGFEKLGQCLGLFHDFGKISPVFAEVLEHKRCHVNHAAPGAALMLYLYGKRSRVTAEQLATVIAAHHSKLDYDSIHCLERIMKGDGSRLDEDGSTFSLFGQQEFQNAVTIWQQQVLQGGRTPFCALPPEKDAQRSLVKMLQARFLLSALADADYSCTAEHFLPGSLAECTGPLLDAEQALRRLLSVREEKRKGSTAASSLNQLRDELFDTCLTAAELPSGLFTLTAPTGLGKTLSLFAFAARHCVKHHKRRIILILPYLSIIEQNVRDYREVEPNLIESHSLAALDDSTRQLAERWTAPCIVTTNVGFFEPLFSARPTDCRRLHQLANSVIVLDEAQSLPEELLEATLNTVRLLCSDYGCTVVFSTATQPAFAQIKGMEWHPTEIVKNAPELFRQTVRVTYDWRLSASVSLESIASELLALPQCCVIVNLRRHARKLFRLLCEAEPCDESIFYLTTDLCPAHRQQVIREVNERLRAGKPCRLVATSCIEAGVDLSFPVLYRALAPLESIIQAAGRCNRNGSGPDGRVVIFLPDEKSLYPPGTYYAHAANCVRSIAMEHPIDCTNLAQIDEYYAMVYCSRDGDKQALNDAINQENFSAVADAYRLIDQRGVQVIVPCPGQEELFSALRDAYDAEGLTPQFLRNARMLTVTTFEEKSVKETCVPLFPRRRGESEEPFHAACYLLGDPSFYNPKLGLSFESENNSVSIF